MLSLHPVFWGAKSNTEQAGLSNQQEWLKDQTSQGDRVVFSGGRKQKKDFLIHYASIFLGSCKSSFWNRLLEIEWETVRVPFCEIFR
jgi:hypothetical protein